MIFGDFRGRGGLSVRHVGAAASHGLPSRGELREPQERLKPRELGERIRASTGVKSLESGLK